VALCVSQKLPPVVGVNTAEVFEVVGVNAAESVVEGANTGVVARSVGVTWALDAKGSELIEAVNPFNFFEVWGFVALSPALEVAFQSRMMQIKRSQLENIALQLRQNKDTNRAPLLQLS